MPCSNACHGAMPWHGAMPHVCCILTGDSSPPATTSYPGAPAPYVFPHHLIMNVIAEIQRINQAELESGSVGTSASWHAKYADSAWVFVGNLPMQLTEGDVICVMSQFGEVSSPRTNVVDLHARVLFCLSVVMRHERTCISSSAPCHGRAPLFIYLLAGRGYKSCS